MSEAKQLQKDANNILKQTSRTFYIPITLLKSPLNQTVGSAYLCMRAVDEIEDNEELDSETKQHLLRSTSKLLKQDNFDEQGYRELVHPYDTQLPEVTLRLGDWIKICPAGIVENVKESTSVMAAGMADWAERGWDIKDETDLDDYTYYVAGLVGVMLSDIWKWYDGTETDRELAIGYGRGLQAVNILRNQDEDSERGVSFVPDGWTRDDLFTYTEKNLAKADEYMKDINTRTIKLFCRIPLALAKRTVKALKEGREKISRQEVETIVEDIKND
ncbi:squalene/phytoene synthase family protein [Lentibacillus sp. CBA3610]|uniref:squalene/phytoene synthase family protein n=1 Tax=Lentibacillus sp. CBA3610 TaxID=2518176 RepID=UPI001595A158|nr:phytoene/squalene synthase family protein [Lentibacillus sp. CBA3610]QKY71063.1 phytoene/squalene synthase family protein [Lentibacillus sp. CBA3610]